MTLNPDELAGHPDRLFLAAATDDAAEWEAAFANLLTAHEAMVRERVAADLEADPALTNAEMADLGNCPECETCERCGDVWRRYAARVARGPQDAPTAPAQPATDAARDTETTGGTDELSTLRKSIAEALALDLNGPASDEIDCYRRADAVMDVIRPELERRCSCDGDPIECQHEAARGVAEAEAERLKATLKAIAAAHPYLTWTDPNGDNTHQCPRCSAPVRGFRRDDLCPPCDKALTTEIINDDRDHTDQAFPRIREKGPDDLSALCDRIADAIRTAVRVNPDPTLRQLLADNPNSTLVISGAEAHDAAHAVMPIVLAERERATLAEAALGQARAAHLQTCTWAGTSSAWACPTCAALDQTAPDATGQDRT